MPADGLCTWPHALQTPIVLGGAASGGGAVAVMPTSSAVWPTTSPTPSETEWHGEREPAVWGSQAWCRPSPPPPQSAKGRKHHHARSRADYSDTNCVPNGYTSPCALPCPPPPIIPSAHEETEARKHLTICPGPTRGRWPSQDPRQGPDSVHCLPASSSSSRLVLSPRDPRCPPDPRIQGATPPTGTSTQSRAGVWTPLLSSLGRGQGPSCS